MNELFGFQLTPYVYGAGAEPPVGVWEGGREEVTLPSLENWEKSALNFEKKNVLIAFIYGLNFSLKILF